MEGGLFRIISSSFFLNGIKTDNQGGSVRQKPSGVNGSRFF